MRSLEEAERAGKFRYIANVLAERLPESHGGESAELFFRALRALHPDGHHPLRVIGLLCAQCYHRLRRNGRAQCRCVLRRLRLHPNSTGALRQLLKICQKYSLHEELYLAAAQFIAPEKLPREERRKICRKLIGARLGARAAAVAKSILREHPNDAEARHLLWSALLQSGNDAAPANHS